MKQMLALGFVGLLLWMPPLLNESVAKKKTYSYQQGILLDIRKTVEVRRGYYHVGGYPYWHHRGHYYSPYFHFGYYQPYYYNVYRQIYVIKVGDIIYHGRRGGTYLGPWVIGDPIEVRFKKNKMYLKRENRKDLKTKIVKRIRVTTKNQ